MLNGKGYENAHNYPRTQLQFVDIQNIHVMRDSLRRLLGALEAKEEPCAEWLRELGASGWLEHVQAVLRGSRVVVQQIAQHRSVLVHCSDGWDRTSQLTALAQLQLDPFYRSLHGFAVLVEKVRRRQGGRGESGRGAPDDTSRSCARRALRARPPRVEPRRAPLPPAQEWLSFGHQFALRHGSHVHESGTPAVLPPDEQQSPVFVQFVDAVWQLTVLCPRAFEFSQLFLASLLSEAFSNRFGTFLLDTHCARARSGLAQRTRSIWSELLDRPRERGFINPHYWPSAGVLHVDLSGSSLAVFRAYYCRGPWAVDPRDARAMAEAALARR
jgi:myotubularin-related protein 1/2